MPDANPSAAANQGRIKICVINRYAQSNTKAWLGLIFVAVAMGLLLFVPAGTVHYWQAWAYLVVFFGASLLITL
jgi:hypothetical protein